MKKILFVCNDAFGLYKVFQKGFEEYSNCEVTTIAIDHKDYNSFKYKNLKQRIHNFLSKKISGKNLKTFWISQKIIKNISKSDHFDYLLVICPELLHPEHLLFLNSISNKSIVYYWDGFDHFPVFHDTIKYFDECFSFDPIDAKKYNLKFITNFYFVEDYKTETKTDLFFLGSYDSRFPLIEKIALSLEKQNKDVAIYQYIKDDEPVLKSTSKSIIFINKHIPFEETVTFMKETKIVLDIHKDIQHGLSFRVFEAMGLHKKLITTNADIINYDFYNPNNIFVWKKDTHTIPESFLNSLYEELPENVYKKYSQENWVKTILNL